MLTLREIISNGRFESNSRTLLRKPDFFFGDTIEEDEAALYDRNYKWLCQIGDRKFFLLNMERMYPLAYLQHMSVRRIMDWDLVKPYFGVSLGKIGVHEAYTIGHGRGVLGLQPGLVRTEYLIGETPQLGATFIKQFMEVGSDFPSKFHATGWVHSTDKNWWCRMVGFILAELGDILLQVGLYEAVRTIQYSILQSTQHFYAVLERYNPETCAFFTPLGEMGLALYEMYEVSGLVIGDAPYEEYVPSTEELYLLEKKATV